MRRIKGLEPNPMAATRSSTSAKSEGTDRPVDEAAVAPKAQPVSRTRDRRPPPTKGRALKTYEALLKAAGEVLGEVGFEKLTTNDICSRANVTPPALYHYFVDKYDILEALARRLNKKQNDAFLLWLFNGGAWVNLEERRDAMEAWYRIAVGIARSEPGSMWILRAMRALPHLAHVRLESQRELTNRLFEIYHRVYPRVDPKVLWCRLRIACEFGSMVDELAMEEDRIRNDLLFREAARIAAGPTHEGGSAEDT